MYSLLALICCETRISFSEINDLPQIKMKLYEPQDLKLGSQNSGM